MKRKIALLTPRSVLYPTISFDIMAGLKLSLAENGMSEVEIRTENINTGSDDKFIYAVCERLLLEGVSIITGYVNPTSAEMLAPLFAMGDAIFIALDSGFHYRSNMKKAANVFYLSLESALCCRIVTRIATGEGNKRFAYTSSFYDSGYKSGYSFASSLKKNGGEVQFNHITELKRADFDLAPLQDHLNENDTEALFASFCGDMMQDFFFAAAKNNLFEKHAVYASPFMGDEQWLQQVPYPGVDIKTCVSWGRGLGNIANTYFMEVIKENNKNANLFSMMGWEAGILVAKVLKASNNAEAIDKLEGYSYESPRGTIKINSETHQTNAPVYEAWIQRDEATGNCALKVLHESIFTDEERGELEYDIDNFPGVSSKWYNAYGCLES